MKKQKQKHPVPFFCRPNSGYVCRGLRIANDLLNRRARLKLKAGFQVKAGSSSWICQT